MKTRHFLIGICIAALLWGLFIWFPKVLMFLKPEWCDGSDYYSKLNTAYVAAGALFTALAFGVTFFTIASQRKENQRKSTLTVFTETFSKIQDDPVFISALSYIRNNYARDLESLKNKRKIGVDFNVGIEDFKKLPKRKRQNTSDPYLTVRYFCDKMDYIGILIYKEFVDNVLLDYFGDTVIETYKTVSEQLTVTRQRSGCNIFPNYTRLYDMAVKRMPRFMSKCDDYMHKRSLSPIKYWRYKLLKSLKISNLS